MYNIYNLVSVLQNSISDGSQSLLITWMQSKFKLRATHGEMNLSQYHGWLLYSIEMQCVIHSWLVYTQTKKFAKRVICGIRTVDLSTHGSYIKECSKVLKVNVVYAFMVCFKCIVTSWTLYFVEMTYQSQHTTHHLVYCFRPVGSELWDDMFGWCRPAVVPATGLMVGVMDWSCAVN